MTYVPGFLLEVYVMLTSVSLAVSPDNVFYQV